MRWKTRKSIRRIGFFCSYFFVFVGITMAKAQKNQPNVVNAYRLHSIAMRRSTYGHTNSHKSHILRDREMVFEWKYYLVKTISLRLELSEPVRFCLCVLLILSSVYAIFTHIIGVESRALSYLLLNIIYFPCCLLEIKTPSTKVNRNYFVSRKNNASMYVPCTFSQNESVYVCVSVCECSARKLNNLFTVSQDREQINLELGEENVSLHPTNWKRILAVGEMRGV